jgi:hypothetical protein
VDFVINGTIPIGSVSIDANGSAALTGAVWAPGIATVDAIWTQYVAGVASEKTVSAQILIL